MSLIYDDVKAGRDGDPAKFAAIHRDLEEQGCDGPVHEAIGKIEKDLNLRAHDQ